jgi:hypothetical protein
MRNDSSDRKPAKDKIPMSAARTKRSTSIRTSLRSHNGDQLEPVTSEPRSECLLVPEFPGIPVEGVFDGQAG